MIALSFISSCQTIRKVDSYIAKEKEPVNYIIIPKSVVITDKYSNDDVSSMQIKTMLESMLWNLENEKQQFKFKEPKPLNDFNSEQIELDLVINQRPFIKNFSEFNSLYIQATYTHKEKGVVSSKGIYIETQGTIVSSVVQKEIIDELNLATPNMKMTKEEAEILNQQVALLEDRFKNCIQPTKSTGKDDMMQ